MTMRDQSDRSNQDEPISETAGKTPIHGSLASPCITEALSNSPQPCPFTPPWPPCSLLSPARPVWALRPLHMAMAGVPNGCNHWPLMLTPLRRTPARSFMRNAPPCRAGSGKSYEELRTCQSFPPPSMPHQLPWMPRNRAMAFLFSTPLKTLLSLLSLRLSRPHLCFNLWRRPCRVGQREGVFLFGFGGCLRAIPFNCITVILPSL